METEKRAAAEPRRPKRVSDTYPSVEEMEFGALRVEARGPKFLVEDADLHVHLHFSKDDEKAWRVIAALGAEDAVRSRWSELGAVPSYWLRWGSNRRRIIVFVSWRVYEEVVATGVGASAD